MGWAGEKLANEIVGLSMATKSVMCGCGKQIVQLDNTEFWRLADSGEVCTDGHWHKPMAVTPPKPAEPERKRPHQRAHGDVERGFVSCYAKDEADAIFESLEAELRSTQRSLQAQIAGAQRGPEFYAYTPGLISDERLEGMIDETRWWKVPGDEIYEVVRELRDARKKIADMSDLQDKK